ncbi:MAG: Ig domain-containing protein, partial [Gemmatimonadetes bacterium]
MAAGAATITATCEKMSGAAAATVAAPAPLPVASVSVSPAAPSLTVGATVQLAATPLDASGTPLSGRVVTWATSSAAVATVSGSGL